MTRKAAAPPAVADPTAKAKLEAAAQAAGLSLQALADLIYEAGVVPPPSSDGLTQRYTLHDLGKKLLTELQTQVRDSRSAWFHELAPVQQKALICVLREEGYPTETIARELRVDPADVMRTWNTYASELGSQVVGLRLDTIAGQMQVSYEKAMHLALEKGDGRAVFAIEKDRIAVLQGLGITEKAVHRVEVTHKMDEEQKAELERLVELRGKQERRRIEIAELDQKDEEGDALPEDLTEDYDDDD